MAMASGFSSLVNDYIDGSISSIPCSNISNVSSILAENRLLLESTQERTERLERDLEVERANNLDLQGKLDYHNQVPQDVIFHTEKLYDILRRMHPQVPNLTYSRVHTEDIWPDLAAQQPTTPPCVTLSIGAPAPAQQPPTTPPFATMPIRTPAPAQQPPTTPPFATLPMRELAPAQRHATTPPFAARPAPIPAGGDWPPVGQTVSSTPPSVRRTPDTPPSSVPPAAPFKPSREQPDSLRPLIIDPEEPSKYNTAKVDNYKLYNLERKTLKTGGADAVTQHLNAVINMVFPAMELSSCTGLGLRTSKDASLTSRPLDSLKVKAVKEYMKSFCRKNGLPELDDKLVNRKFTYKITNSRRELKKMEQ